jgi:hypothetical protein
MSPVGLGRNFGESSHDSQRHETVKYDHESRGLRTKNDCAGEAQQQLTRPNDRNFALRLPSAAHRYFPEDATYTDCMSPSDGKLNMGIDLLSYPCFFLLYRNWPQRKLHIFRNLIPITCNGTELSCINAASASYDGRKFRSINMGVKWHKFHAVVSWKSLNMVQMIVREKQTWTWQHHNLYIQIK